MSARGGRRPGAMAGGATMLRRWLPPLLLLFALLPIALKVPAAARFSEAILTYPFQVDDSEGVILSEAQLLARGVDPYQPARPDFFTAAPYTPIFTLINAAAFVVGPFTFKVGRGVAYLATLAVALLVGGLVWWRVGRPLLGLWAGLGLLTIDLVSVWSTRARPDHLALACNLAGFAMIWLRWRDLVAAPYPGDRWGLRPAGWRALALATLCFALGFYTKQTLLAAPVAVTLGLLLARPRVGVAFGLLYGAAVALPFALLTAITQGGFYQKIVALHSSWGASDFLRLALPALARYWPLLLGGLALPLAVGGTAARDPRPLAALRADPDLLPALYLPVAAFFALGAGTHGGNHNHFVETLVVAVFCATLAIGRFAAQGRGLPLAVALLVALSLALGWEERLGGSGWLARDFRPPLAREREGWANVAAFVTNDPGPVYADNVGLLLVAGKEVRYTDPFSLAFAVRTGRWDDSALVARVERGEFSLIELRYDLFAPGIEGPPDDLTPGLYAAIRARYRVIESNVVILYAPK
jgi:hypothetical protein